MFNLVGAMKALRWEQRTFKIDLIYSTDNLADVLFMTYARYKSRTNADASLSPGCESFLASIDVDTRYFSDF